MASAADQRIETVIEFWFSAGEQLTPTIDSRMERWFGAEPAFDAEIRERFAGLVGQASEGQLMEWPDSPTGRLALILVLDQFRRHIYRGTADAFSADQLALKLCVEGARSGDYKALPALQQAFFFMPLQHAENLKAQDRAVRIYQALAESTGETLRETLLTFAQFAELHRDIIDRFGRFPHRNAILGRGNTPEEESFLGDGAPAFGQ